MYNLVLQLHHYIAFIALILLAYATLQGVLGMNTNKAFTDSNRKVNTFALISTHVMLLLGLILLAVSPTVQGAFSDMGAAMKDSYLRKTAVEHPLTNVIAVVLATIGNAKSKKAIGNGVKFRHTAVYFGLALILILSRLPFDRLFAF